MRKFFESAPFAASYVRWMFAFSMVANVLLLAPAIYTLQVYDRVLHSGSMATLGYLMAIMLGAVALGGLADYTRRLIAIRLSNRYAAERYESVVWSISSVDNRHRDADSVLRDFANVRNFLGSSTAVGIFDVPFTAIFLIFLFLLNVWLGLLVLFALIALSAISYATWQKSDRLREARRQAENEAGGFVAVSVRKSDELQAMAMTGPLMERWALKLLAAMTANEESGDATAAYGAASKALRQGLQIVVITLGAFLVLSGLMSGGALFATILLTNRVLSPVDRIISGRDTILRAARSLAVIEEIAVDARLPEPRPNLPSPAGRVSVKSVSRRASGSRNGSMLLSDVTFDISPGEIVAVAGPSGSGKSTLARIVAGAVVPSEGQLMLDSALRAQWSDAQWGQSVGYVAQDVEFFPATVAENIARLSFGFDEDRLMAAVRLADIHEMILGFPEGYATRLGTGAFWLSGGQKQKLALARAFYGDPALFVFDEPDAHLDSSDAQKFRRALRKLRKSGKAILIVSHRSSTLDLADRVLHLEKGLIASITSKDVSDTGAKMSVGA